MKKKIDYHSRENYILSNLTPTEFELKCVVSPTSLLGAVNHNKSAD